MSALYLLDTNIVSEQTLSRPNTGLIARMNQHTGELAIAAPTWHELNYGAYRLPEGSRRRDDLDRYIRDVVSLAMDIFPYDDIAAEWHAAERARLVAIGLTPPYVDGQIAAIAATNGLTLVTANLADFAHFNGLRVEDWRT